MENIIFYSDENVDGIRGKLHDHYFPSGSPHRTIGLSLHRPNISTSILPRLVDRSIFFKMPARCPICQEKFVPIGISALKCGHTFHSNCVSDWLKKSSSCPSCRQSIDEKTDLAQELFFDPGEDTEIFDLTRSPVNKKVTELTEKVSELEIELNHAKSTIDKAKEETTQLKSERDKFCSEVIQLWNVENGLRTQLENFKATAKEEQRKLRSDVEKLSKTSEELKKQQAVLMQQIDEIELENGELRHQKDELFTMNEAFKQQMEALKPEIKAKPAEKKARKPKIDVPPMIPEDGGEAQQIDGTIPIVETPGMSLRPRRNINYYEPVIVIRGPNRFERVVSSSTPKVASPRQSGKKTGTKMLEHSAKRQKIVDDGELELSD